jgi:hypothetical protein
VIVSVRVCDREPDWHRVEKPRRIPEVIANMKREFVNPGDKLRAFKQRTIRAAIGVSNNAGNQSALTPESMQFDSHSGGRPASGNVEDVGGQLSGPCNRG